MWADNRFPLWFTIVSLAVICVVTVLHVGLVRDTAFDRHLNFTMIAATIACLLREPAVALWIAPVVPGGTPVINDLWHFAFALTCTSVFGLFLNYNHGNQPWAPIVYRSLLAATVAIGVAFIVLSTPTRAHGLLLQDAPQWRYAAYFGLYCLIPVVTCAYGFIVLLSMRRSARGRRDKAIVVLFLAIAFAGAVNMTSLFIGALLASGGADGPFAQQTAIRAGGELILPFVAALYLGFAPSALRAAAGALRIDKASRAACQLRPAWRDLTAATPAVRIHMPLADRLGAGSIERLHCLEREVKNAVAIVARFADEAPADVESAITARVPEADQESMHSAVELLLAARRITAAGGVEFAGEPNPWGPTLTPSELARLWPVARRLCDAVPVDAVVAR